MKHPDQSRPSQGIGVYRADHLRVVSGANLGDPLGCYDDLLLDDIYHLSPIAALSSLSLLTTAEPPFLIAAESETGQPGADLHLDCCITLMSGNGQTTECLILIETDGQSNIADIHVLPLAPMMARTDYALVGVDRWSALQKFAQVACVSFTRGTRITLASGAQRKVEDLSVGDRVLTRDDGPQEIRWIGHTTVRATGAFAPIRIAEGALHNVNDLVVCPDHRLFIYQRTDRLGAGRSEVLIKARYLVDDIAVTRVNGGYVDYFQMLFDHHQIIYAEGIAAESMMVDTRTRALLPNEVSERFSAMLPGHHVTAHADIEVQDALLHRPGLADLLRKSSDG